MHVSTGGPVVERTEALARQADLHRVFVSRTVVDLLPGSGLAFEARTPLGNQPVFAVVANRGVPNKTPA